MINFINYRFISDYIVSLSLNFILLLILFNLAVCVIIQTVHFMTLSKPSFTKPKLKKSNIKSEPFISIHVPSYNEPSDILIETLNAIKALKYKNYEVIILDNNTPDSSVYEPVKHYCEELGSQFRFYHFDNVKGAKAGALNIALELTNSRAEHVAVIDADYQVMPNFLSVAAKHLANSGVSFVQFPQAYRGSSSHTAAVEEELADYFEAFARRANENSAVLLTGTLSVLRISHLKSVGGWSGKTVTEDAELGVRLFMKGYSGIFVPQIVGRGLLPLSFISLQKQRDRWVAGNAQTLIKTLSLIISNGWRKGALSVIAQLTAWPAFWLVPSIFLIFASLMPSDTAFLESATFLASITILGSSLTVTARLLLCAYIKKQSLNHIPAALMVKLALVWTSSFSFLPALAGKSIGFARTSKTVGSDIVSGRSFGLSIGSAFFAKWVLCVSALACSVVYSFQGHFLASFACFLIASSIPAAWRVETCLIRYSKNTANNGDRYALCSHHTNI